MSYLNQDAIASNAAMVARVSQCAAEQGDAEPDNWTIAHRREWAAAPGWADAWASSLASHPPVEDEATYDPGRDEAVITDTMILGQVQAMIA